jgi:hypothetical protein
MDRTTDRRPAHHHSTFVTAAIAHSARLHRQTCTSLPSAVSSTAHRSDGACSTWPPSPKLRLTTRLHSPTRPWTVVDPISAHPLLHGTARDDTHNGRTPCSLPSSGPPLCDGLATASSPARSSILTPASQPHTFLQPAGCSARSTAQPSSCPAHHVGVS